MKTLLKFSFLFILLSLLTTSSCNKPDPEPHPTGENTEPPLPTGENTAYYYLDGQLVIPKGYTSGVSFVKPIGYGGCMPESSRLIYFQNPTERLYIYFLNGIQTTGTIYLTTSNSGYDFCQNVNSIGMMDIRNTIESNYYFTQNNSGTVNITYLSENKRQFKGTFEMTVYNSNGIVSPHITGGHFNINLDTL